jgi:hypothetical protein
MAGGLQDTTRGWNSYQAHLEFLATDELEKKALVAKNMSRRWCLGSREFRRDMRTEAAHRGAQLDDARFTGLEPEEVRQERATLWEEKLTRLAQAAKIDLKALRSAKSHPDKVLLAAALDVFCLAYGGGPGRGN